MAEKTKAAIVGLGRIASLLEDDALREKPCTHAGALAANPDCDLVAGCDSVEERRALFAQRWDVQTYADAGEMLKAHRPSVLAVATHPDSHYRYCRLAADMGVSAVICEKPLADGIRGARAIARLSRTAGAGGPAIVVNHERRYSEDYVRARGILREEKLGRLLSARAVLCMGASKRLLDVLWHDGTHLADALMFLTDSRLRHRARRGARLSSRAGACRLEGELIGVARNGAATATPAVIEIGAGRDHLVFEAEFSCERGRLRIGNGVFEVWESAPSPYAEGFRSLKRSDEVFDGPTGYFANMVKDAVACAVDPDRAPVSGAADGLRVIEYLNSVKAWRR